MDKLCPIYGEGKKKFVYSVFSGMEMKSNYMFFCPYIDQLWTTAKDQTKYSFILLYKYGEGERLKH